MKRLASVHKWVVTESKRFVQTRHINLLELDVLDREYADLCINVEGGLRAVNLERFPCSPWCCSKGPLE